MKILLDTHLLLWAISDSRRLSPLAFDIIGEPENQPIFSVASLWEIVIKSVRDKQDFQVDAHVLCRRLLDNGYAELPISSQHVLAVAALPAIHRDPFDRVLVAQAMVEGITLLTVDPHMLRYPGPIQRV